MSVFTELKRRNVFKVAMLYLLASWLLLQVTDVLSSLMSLPPWAGPLVVMLLLLGFIPALVFSWVYELTPEGIKREKDIDRSDSMSHMTGQRINLLIIVLVLVAIGAVVADRLIPEQGAITGPAATPLTVEDSPGESTAADTAEEPSIAVLPFENFTGKDEDEYFSDGLSDTVLHHLAQVPGLKVIARNSTFQFKGTNLDVRDIGGQLGVANILEGSVQRYGDQVRVIAQLVRSADGAHLWSQSFDYRMDNIFALHDAIAAAVVEQLKLSLLPEETAALAQGATDNPEAYDLFLQARAYINEHISPSVVNSTGNIEDFAATGMLRRALALDPDYVDALVDLADVHGMFAFLTTDNGRYREYLTGMRPLVDRALALAPDYSRTWSAKGGLEFRSGNQAAAIASQRKAIELNPNDAEAHGHLAVALLEQDPEATLEHMRIRNELDPAATFDRPVTMALLFLQRPGEAVERLEKSVAENGPTEMELTDLSAINFWIFGRPAEAARWTGKLLEHAPQSSLGVQHMVRNWLAVGDTARAQAWLAFGLARWPGNDSLELYSLRLALVQGDAGLARESLSDIEGWPGMPGLEENLWRMRVCLLASEVDCAREAEARLTIALEQAMAMGREVTQFEVQQQLYIAEIERLRGEAIGPRLEALQEMTGSMPRISWRYTAKGYVDIEAAILQGLPEQALALLDQTLLADGGYMPWDSLGLPADEGHIVGRLAAIAGFASWQAAFNERREASHKQMLEMETSGSLPPTPEVPARSPVELP